MDHKGLSRLKKHFQFVVAKNFQNKDGSSFLYSLSLCERLGKILLVPFTFPLEFLLSFFSWQIVLMIITMTALVMASIFYYPDQIAKVISWIVPLISREQAKFLCYLWIQCYLIGMLLRTLGRLSNPVLKNAWISGNLQAILPGARPARL